MVVASVVGHERVDHEVLILLGRDVLLDALLDIIDESLVGVDRPLALEDVLLVVLMQAIDFL